MKEQPDTISRANKRAQGNESQTTKLGVSQMLGDAEERDSLGKLVIAQGKVERERTLALTEMMKRSDTFGALSQIAKIDYSGITNALNMSGLLSQLSEFDTSVLAGITRAHEETSLFARIRETNNALNSNLLGIARSPVFSELTATTKALAEATSGLSEIFSRAIGDNREAIESAHAYLESERQREREREGNEEAFTTELVANPVGHAARKAVSTLNQNTRERFTEMSWFEIIAAIWFLYGLATTLNSVMNEDLAEILQANRAEVSHVREMMEGYIQHLDITTAEATYIANLPRGRIKVIGNVREQPTQSSGMISRLKSGEEVAIIEREGMWLHVYFQDSITSTLQLGWIYSQSIERY